MKKCLTFLPLVDKKANIACDGIQENKAAGIRLKLHGREPLWEPGYYFTKNFMTRN